MAEDEFILTLRCPDRPGILAGVSGALAQSGADIRDASQYGDPDTNTFFIRMHLVSPQADKSALARAFEPVAKSLGLTWHLHEAARKLKVLVAVSKQGHCLVDLLHRTHIDMLPVDIVGVISNHPDLRSLVDWYGHAYWHLPVTPETRAEQERAIAGVMAETRAELLVLARYMQVLSDGFSRSLDGRCINIHHSFLPSFKGASPYTQAHRRGVKLIGATAHYVTPDLDEGPIIEQDVRRVTHAATPAELVALGREIEASVLARAVRWHAEHRVFLSGQRTIVLQ